MGSFFSNLGANLKVLGQAAVTNIGTAARAVGNFLTQPIATTPSRAQQTANISSIIPASVNPTQSTPFGKAGPIGGQGQFVNVPGVGAVNVSGFQTGGGSSFAPNMSTPFGPAQAGPGGTTVFNQQQIRPIVVPPGGVNTPPAGTQTPPGLGSYTPPKPGAPPPAPPAFQGVSTSQQGVSSGGAPTGVSGGALPGAGGGFTSKGAAFTSGQSTSSGIGSGTDKTDEDLRVAPPPQFVPLANPLAIPSGFTATSTPGGGTGYADAQGNLYLPTQNGLQLAPQTLEGQLPTYVDEKGITRTAATGAPQVSTKTAFTAGVTPEQIQIQGILNATKKTLNDILTNPKVNITQESFNDLVNQEVQTISNRIKSENPTPDQPVRPTPGQDLLERDAATKARMDSVRLNLGLPPLEKKRIDLMTQYEAMLEGVNKIIKSISENPEFPKALAERRIAEFSKQSGIALKAIQGQLGIVNQQIKDANDQLDQFFSIQKDENAELSRERDDSRQMLQIAISSKGIANMTDEQLQDFAKSGFSMESLQQIRSSVQAKGGDVTNVQYKLDETTGNVTAYGLDSNNRIVNLGTLESVTTPGSGRFTDTQLNQGAQTAGLPYQAFVDLNDDVKNEFIFGNVDELKKDMDTDLSEGVSPKEIEKVIAEAGNLRPEVKDALTRYLKAKTGSTDPNTQVTGFLEPAIKSIFNFFTGK